jgi:hypothetical protein
LDAISSYEMRLEAMRLEADRDYMKAKRSFDNAHDTLRFTALLSPGAAFVMCTLPISSHYRQRPVLGCSCRRSVVSPIVADVDSVEGRRVLYKSYQVLR